LPFYKEVLIALPCEIMAASGENSFVIKLLKPNGKKDEWEQDNIKKSKFNNIPCIPSEFVVDFLSNNRPEENSLFILNNSGDTVFQKFSADIDSATNYSDTLKLAEGKYHLHLTDSLGDGLEFWFQPEAGYGRLRLKDVNGNLIHLFEK